jgi:hypothetical protein
MPGRESELDGVGFFDANDHFGGCDSTNQSADRCRGAASSIVAVRFRGKAANLDGGAIPNPEWVS